MSNITSCSTFRKGIQLLFALALGAAIGCASNKSGEKQSDEFFTSGSPEADRRADNAVADEGKDNARSKGGPTTEKKLAEEKQTLYDRLGGEAGISAIVDDFIQRVLADPRVNWSREGVVKRSWFRRDESVAWSPTPANVTQLKQHFVEFISLAAGGPIEYGGQPIKASHSEMQISKPEFDAAIGDLKASLDKLGVAPELQKELLAIMESTRPQIVLER